MEPCCPNCKSESLDVNVLYRGPKRFSGSIPNEFSRRAPYSLNIPIDGQYEIEYTVLYCKDCGTVLGYSSTTFLEKIEFKGSGR